MHMHYAQDQMKTPQVVKKVQKLQRITVQIRFTIQHQSTLKLTKYFPSLLHWPQLSFTFQLMDRRLTISTISKGLTAMKLIRIIIHSYAWYKTNLL